VGLGSVPKGEPFDFSFEVKCLNFTEATAFCSVYMPAIAAVDSARTDRMVRTLTEVRLKDEARRVEVMRKAQEAGIEADALELQPAQELMKALLDIRCSKAEENTEFVAKVPEGWVERVFGSYVRKVEDLSIYGEPVTEGSRLFCISDSDITATVLGCIYNRAKLSATEGKASSSPSISPQGDEIIQPGG
jgi:hypothetical protein